MVLRRPSVALALLLGAVPALAQGDEVFGVIKSVDPATGRVVLRREGSQETMTLRVRDLTSIEDKDHSMRLANLKPGDHVVVQEEVSAADIFVEEEVAGTIRSVDPETGHVGLELEGGRVEELRTGRSTVIQRGRESEGARAIDLYDLQVGDSARVVRAADRATVITVASQSGTILQEFWENFRHNLFKPLLLFFYMGFLIPILGVKFEFPYVIYQGLTLYLLISIGWHGGEELAALPGRSLGQAAGFMAVGFLTNTFIGILAYVALRATTRLRRVDAATVSGYYGSDSAGTFVTCLGVLSAASIKYQAYMPVMLAVMEIPGCLVALYLISRLRANGMDPAGTMPDEPGYDPNAEPPLAAGVGDGHGDGNGHGEAAAVHHPRDEEALELERELALEKRSRPTRYGPRPRLNAELLHEVFFNPGIYLLFGGILVGYVSRLQGPKVTAADDPLFLTLFQGVLCLFLLEMGMTASRKLRDLRTAGPRFVAFGLIAPNVFAILGIAVATAYSHAIGVRFDLGTYVLFAVLCGAASYIAVPAIQRLAIPEASPTLPLAASLGLTFSYNVTIGIPVYIEIARLAMAWFPVAG